MDHFIAKRVAILVIDLLKVVNVDHEQGVTLLLVLQQDLTAALIHGRLVEQVGHWIMLVLEVEGGNMRLVRVDVIDLTNDLDMASTLLGVANSRAGMPQVLLST